MITCNSFLQPNRLGRAAVIPATRVQTRVGAFQKRIGKNRPVQEALDMKLVAELGKIVSSLNSQLRAWRKLMVSQTLQRP